VAVFTKKRQLGLEKTNRAGSVWLLRLVWFGVVLFGVILLVVLCAKNHVERNNGLTIQDGFVRFGGR